MDKKAAPASPRIKRPDHLGRTKDHRHGTRSWTTWLSAARMAPPRWLMHHRKHGP